MASAQTKAEVVAGPERPSTPRSSPAAAPLPLPPRAVKAAPAATVGVAGGAVRLGAALDGSAGFVWDNEGPPAPSPTEVGRASFHEHDVKAASPAAAGGARFLQHSQTPASRLPLSICGTCDRQLAVFCKGSKRLVGRKHWRSPSVVIPCNSKTSACMCK